MISRREIGNIGESLVKNYLRDKNFQIIEENFRLGNLEVDIIAFDNSLSKLVFFEVKTRFVFRGDNFNIEHNDLNLKKNQISRLKKALTIYSEQNGYDIENVRLDYVEVFLNKNNGLASLRHVRDILFG